MGVDPTVEAARLPVHETEPLGFADLWDRHSARAMQLAGLLTGNASAAEDVVAEAFARVYPKWRRGSVDAFWPYLRTAIVNQVRGQARRRLSVQRWQNRQAATPGVASPELEVAERAALAGALGQLPPAQRRALILRYFEDLSEADTARLLGCGVGTVKSSTSRGLARLREVLAEENPDA